MRLGTFINKVFKGDEIDKRHIADMHFKSYIYECVEYLKDYVKITPDIVLNKELLTELVNQIFKKVYSEYNHIDEHFSEKLIAEQKVRELKAKIAYLDEKNELLEKKIDLLEVVNHNLRYKQKKMESNKNERT